MAYTLSGCLDDSCATTVDDLAGTLDAAPLPAECSRLADLRGKPSGLVIVPAGTVLGDGSRPTLELLYGARIQISGYVGCCGGDIRAGEPPADHNIPIVLDPRPGGIFPLGVVGRLLVGSRRITSYAMGNGGFVIHGSPPMRAIDQLEFEMIRAKALQWTKGAGSVDQTMAEITLRCGAALGYTIPTPPAPLPTLRRSWWR